MARLCADDLIAEIVKHGFEMNSYVRCKSSPAFPRKGLNCYASWKKQAEISKKGQTAFSKITEVIRMWVFLSGVAVGALFAVCCIMISEDSDNDHRL